MKKMTKILLIVAAAMVGLGIVLSAIGFAVNGGVTSVRMIMNPFGHVHGWFGGDEEDVYDDETDDYFYYNGSWHHEETNRHHGNNGDFGQTDSTSSATYQGQQSVDQNQVDSLHLESHRSEVQICQVDGSKEFSVKTDGQYQIYVENGVLHIKADENQNKHELFIGIPKDFKLTEAELDIAASNVTIDDLEAKEFDLELGAGQVEIKNLTADQAEFEVGAGEVVLSGGKIGKLDTKVGMGNISYRGTIEQYADVECHMGNTDIILEAELDDYNYELQCGAGNIDIGKESYSGLSQKKMIDHQKNATIKVECNMGNVSIDSAN